MFDAKIISISGMPVRRILLELNPTDAAQYTFWAGQYLEIVTPSHVIPMSIASAPSRLPQIELHFRANPNAPDAQALNDALAQEKYLSITSPQGDVRSGELDQPLLIIAGGSGAAQAFSCIEARHGKLAPTDSPCAPTTVVWCADQASDIYAEAELARFPNVTVYAHVDDRRTPENEGLVWLSVHALEYQDAYILIAGSPGFVNIVTELLISKNIPRGQLHSDMYAFT